MFGLGLGLGLAYHSMLITDEPLMTVSTNNATSESSVGPCFNNASRQPNKAHENDVPSMLSNS